VEVCSRYIHTFFLGFLEVPRLIDFYRPLVMLSFALIFHIFGPAPGWFHLVAFSLHVVATYLVYRLAYEATGDGLLSAIAAGIFGLHPTKVETAAWISGISDSLSLVFFLTSIIWYFRWREGDQRKARCLAISSAFLLLALLEGGSDIRTDSNRDQRIQRFERNSSAAFPVGSGLRLTFSCSDDVCVGGENDSCSHAIGSCNK